MGLSFALLGSTTAFAAPDPAQLTFAKDILPVLREHCFACHGNGQKKGGITLDGFRAEADVHRAYQVWEKLRRLLQADEMPPEGRKPRPTPQQRDMLAAWTRHTLDQFYRTAPPDPGRVTVRRLNRVEYNNTVRDLMLTDFAPAANFPADDAGYGFDNIGDVLTMSPLLLEKYLAAAEQIAEKAIAVPGKGATLDRSKATPFQQRYFQYPLDKDRGAAAAKFLQQFMRRAYRRTVAPDEVTRVLRFVTPAIAAEGSFEHGMRLAVQAVLVSPHFLFRWELDGAPNNAAVVRTLNETELASRLAYFIWSSLPDDRLLQLAETGALRKNLTTEVARMLSDPKAAALVENFSGQWLELRNLTRAQPDPKLFPMFDNRLREDMRRETTMLFTSVMLENRSVLDLLGADYTFINERLARLYGIAGVSGEQFQRVSLRGTGRAGVLTHASVLTVTSDPNRTSPVKRGKYVLENILGTPPPPPPPNVPELARQGEIKGTLREQMVKHRQNAVCASCHEKMDPLGFAFEHFDAIGRYRTQDNGQPVDASGKMEGGAAFTNAVQFNQILIGQKRGDFVRCLSEKMLTYALGRGLEFYDKRAVDGITRQMERGGNSFGMLIMGIVTSLPFDMKRGEVR